MLIPRQTVPALAADLLDGGRFELAEDKPQNFSLIVFYRGLHCPICAKYLIELDRLVGEFETRGVSVIALSSDDQERTAAMRDKIGAKRLRFGYGLSLETARNWGLYLSTSRGKTSAGVDEPALFAEPGVFIVRPDGTLYYGSVQTMPFARPHFDELLQAIEFALKNNYPARGEYVGVI